MSIPTTESPVDEHIRHGGLHSASREPAWMIVPLILLAIGSIAAGLLNYPPRATWSLGHLLGQSPSVYLGHLSAVAEHGVMSVPRQAFGLEFTPGPVKGPISHTAMLVISGVLAAVGIFAAWWFHLHRREQLGRLSRAVPWLVRVLEAKYWVDEIYHFLFVRPFLLLSRVLDVLDLVVTAVVWGMSYLPKLGGFGVSLATQRGMVQGYAVVSLIGLAVLLIIFL